VKIFSCLKKGSDLRILCKKKKIKQYNFQLKSGDFCFHLRCAIYFCISVEEEVICTTSYESHTFFHESAV
jgi:hypothetical protein